MNRVEHVDPSTSGALLYRIDDSGSRQQTISDVWGDQIDKPWSSIVLATAIEEASKNEASKEKLDAILRRIKPFDAFKNP